MHPSISTLTDDTLLSLFSSDPSQVKTASELVIDALHTALQETTVSKLFGSRTLLNDCYPIVGKYVGHGFFTKHLVGYNFRGRNSKKVNIPLFNVLCCAPWAEVEFPSPVVLRRVLNESIDAFDVCELEYVHDLMGSISQYNLHYPLIHSKLVDIDTQFVQWASHALKKGGLCLRAILASTSLVEQLVPVAQELGVPLITQPGWDTNVIDLFGNSPHPDFTSGHLIDNGVGLLMRNKELQQRENVGILMSNMSTLRIHIDGKVPELTPISRSSITAYVVSENEGVDDDDDMEVKRKTQEEWVAYAETLAKNQKICALRMKEAGGVTLMVT